MDEFTSALPRRVMTLFLLVDSSGSMSASGNIAKVNRAIEEMIPLLSDISDENEQAEIKLAVMTFDSDVRWVTKDENGNPGPACVYDFVWNDVIASGLTSLGAAFTELESKLSRRAFMASATGALAPVIILLSDGVPTDNYAAALEKLSHNNWFKVASKIAIAVEGADRDILAQFTRNSEAVLECDNRTDLKRLMVNLAVVSSKMQSRSVGVDELQGQNAGDLESVGDNGTENILNGIDFTPTIQPVDGGTAEDDGW